MAFAGDPEVEDRTPSGRPPTRRDAAAALLAGAVLAPSAATAQTPPTSQAQPPASQPAAGSEPASQTLKTGQDLSERMTAAVHINGKGPFHFLVDTGANQSGLSAELAAQLQLPAGQPVLVHGIAAPYLCQTVNVEDARIGTLRMPLRNAPIFTRADLGADGLIGLDVLHDRVVALDFLQQEIEISRRNFDRSGFNVFGPSMSQTIVPARQRFGQLTIIDAEAGHAKMTCFIDTGAAESVGNMALKEAVQARMRPADVVNYDVLIRSVTGQYVKGAVALVPSMRIGGINFTKFGLAFASLHTFDVWGLSDKPALLVGMDLLKLFAKVTIDFNEREVVFETK